MHMVRSQEVDNSMVEIEAKGLSFEEALAELEAIVERLEGESLSLDETMALYERGRQLAQHCQTLLDAASLKFQRLRPDGTVVDGEELLSPEGGEHP